MKAIKTIFCTLAAVMISFTASAQQQFVITGMVPSLPDGTAVGIARMEDSIVEIADTVVRNGQFVLRGKVKHPVLGMLSTNNLDLVQKNNWPNDSIHWNYIDMFISNDNITLDPQLRLHGGEVQEDFNSLCAIGDYRSDSVAWKFIEGHPTSVISAWLLNNMLKRGYGLTSAEVEHIAESLKGCPADTSRWNEFQWRVAFAKNTTVGSPLIDLEIRDTANRVTHLTDIVPKDGRFVLIDFWASWCGQCLAAFPRLEELGQKYKGDFTIIDLSIDVKDAAWRKAMERFPQPWPQYCTTPAGYKDLFTKYQIGNGVPYFVMISPDGKVMKTPDGVDGIESILKQYLH